MPGKFMKFTMIKEEELDPELMLFLVEDDELGAIIQHPLVYSIPHDDDLNSYVNKTLKQKREILERSLVEEDFRTYVWIHERPHRIEAFGNIEKKIISNKKYWSLLRELWLDSENIWQNKEKWRTYLILKRSENYLMMNEEEKSFLLEKLPKQFYIYRGYSKGDDPKGFSWTLDEEKAKWFSTRFSKSQFRNINRSLSDGIVDKILADKKDVVAFIDGRSEKEIIYIPRKI
jgi:hypothetical protein